MTVSGTQPDSPREWRAVFVGDPERNCVVGSTAEHFPPASIDGYRLKSANEATGVATYGLPREVRRNTCSGCDATWTGLSVAHASCCHRTFATVALFDSHRTAEGDCLDPEQVLTRGGERRLFFRDGMWRGPELTDEQRAKLAKVWGGEAGDPIPA